MLGARLSGLREAERVLERLEAVDRLTAEVNKIVLASTAPSVTMFASAKASRTTPTTAPSSTLAKILSYATTMTTTTTAATIAPTTTLPKILSFATTVTATTTTPPTTLSKILSFAPTPNASNAMSSDTTMTTMSAGSRNQYYKLFSL